MLDKVARNRVLLPELSLFRFRVSFRNFQQAVTGDPRIAFQLVSAILFYKPHRFVHFDHRGMACAVIQMKGIIFIFSPYN